MTMSCEKKRITIAFGTRPEAIKLAPLILQLRNMPNLDLFICVTGQHKEMLSQALQVFSIVPDLDFGIMQVNQNMHETYANILMLFKKHIDEFKPHLVLVHGDTATAAAVSMACFLDNIKVGHIEAGLRTYDLGSPFPEEFNRQLVSKVASYNFSPTEENRANLLREFVDSSKIYVTGNTVVDALDLIKEKINSGAPDVKSIEQLLISDLGFDFRNTKYVLVTAHRRESFGTGIINICDAITDLATIYPSIKFVFPVHPNPNIQTVVSERLSDIENIVLTTPKNYLEFLILLKNCLLVVSDSGGIQEEAPSFGKFLVLMRENTERPEALRENRTVLVGTDRFKIVDAVSTCLVQLEDNSDFRIPDNPFGDGKSSLRIASVIQSVLAQKMDDR